MNCGDEKIEKMFEELFSVESLRKNRKNYEKFRKNRILISLNKYDGYGMLRFRIEYIRSLAGELRHFEIRSR